MCNTCISLLENYYFVVLLKMDSGDSSLEDEIIDDLLKDGYTKNITWGCWWNKYNNNKTLRSSHPRKYINRYRKEGQERLFNDYFSSVVVYTNEQFWWRFKMQGMFSFALYKALAIMIHIFSNMLMQLEGWTFLHCRNASMLFAYWHMGHRLIVSMIMFKLEKS